MQPIMFCVAVTVNGLYSNDSFRNEMAYATATMTAENKNMMPMGDDVNCKFLFKIMTMTPMNEHINPTIFNNERRSLRNIFAAIGVN